MLDSWTVCKFAQPILPFLCGTANCIEEAKILRRQFRPVPINNRLSNAPLHFFSLAPEHRSLICHPHRLQMEVRIEAGRIGSLEFFEERLLIAAAPDIITDVIGVFERQDHYVMPAPVTECA